MKKIRNANDFWRRVLTNASKNGIDPLTFETWLRPTRLVGMQAGCAIVRVPNSEFADVLGERFAPKLAKALEACGEQVRGVRFVIAE